MNNRVPSIHSYPSFPRQVSVPAVEITAAIIFCKNLGVKYSRVKLFDELDLLSGYTITTECRRSMH